MNGWVCTRNTLFFLLGTVVLCTFVERKTDHSGFAGYDCQQYIPGSFRIKCKHYLTIISTVNLLVGHIISIYHCWKQLLYVRMRVVVGQGRDPWRRRTHWTMFIVLHSIYIITNIAQNVCEYDGYKTK